MFQVKSSQVKMSSQSQVVSPSPSTLTTTMYEYARTEDHARRSESERALCNLYFGDRLIGSQDVCPVRG